MNISGEVKMDFLIDLENFSKFYVFPFISTIGFFLNLLSLLVFLNKRRKSNMYIYLVFKTVIELISTIIGSITGFAFCTKSFKHSSYFEQVLIVILVKILPNILYVLFSFCLILIIIDRYLFLSKKHYCIALVPSKFYVGLCVVVTILMNFPLYFTFKISKENNEEYIVDITDFGSSKPIIAYYCVLIIVENVIPLAIMVFMSLMVIKELKKYLLEKNCSSESCLNDITTSVNSNGLLLNSDKTKYGKNDREHKLDVESQLTQMILACSAIFILSRFGETFSAIVIQIQGFYGIYQDRLQICITLFSHLVTILMSSTGFFLYCAYNKFFRKYLRKMFLLKKGKRNETLV